MGRIWSAFSQIRVRNYLFIRDSDSISDPKSLKFSDPDPDLDGSRILNESKKKYIVEFESFKLFYFCIFIRELLTYFINI